MLISFTSFILNVNVINWIICLDLTYFVNYLIELAIE